MMIPTGMRLALWAVFDAIPTLRALWAVLEAHVPTWFNTSFLAAAAAGLLTQLAFSLFASRESRHLNAKTTVGLEEIKRNLIEMATTQLRVRETLLELTARVLSDSAHDSGLPESLGRHSPATPRPGPNGERAEHELGSDLRQVLDNLVDEAGGVLVLRAAYERLGTAVSLQNMLYAVYWLRDVGRITWEDAVIGWETELRRATPGRPSVVPPRPRQPTEDDTTPYAAGAL